MFQRGGIHGPIDEMLRPVLQGTLAYAGMAVLPPHIAWHVPYVGDAERSAMLWDYQEHLGKIDKITPLEFPSLDNFDSRLYPLSIDADSAAG